MTNASDFKGMSEKILKIKELLNELETDPNQFPALLRNSKRALTSIKMLELNICDIVSYNLIDS